MYTELKSYQIIISLLKQRGIKKCVLSAGSRNVPFVHSVEEDPFFECYSVVDERSAGYFALGLAQESGEPVVVSCTSSTATCKLLATCCRGVLPGRSACGAYERSRALACGAA